MEPTSLYFEVLRA